MAINPRIAVRRESVGLTLERPTRCNQVDTGIGKRAIDEVVPTRAHQPEPGWVEAQRALVGCSVVLDDLDQAGPDELVELRLDHGQFGGRWRVRFIHET